MTHISIGTDEGGAAMNGHAPASRLIPYVNVKLSLLGCRPVAGCGNDGLDEIVSTLVTQYREKERLLGNHLCPADQRIQTFLYDYLQDIPVARLPQRTLVLDRTSMARLVSLPPDGDEFVSDWVSSYRVKQGVLHNPRSDRRTTQGIFHIAEGGLPIPGDKKAVPRNVFGKMLSVALAPPPELMRLPFAANQENPVECFVSLLLRPIVCPEVPGFTAEKTMEIRFFAPASLVSNLDFVESIFGNAGDPGLPENDAALDAEHWTGHTGCVILAPHLASITKKDAGLPPWDNASERQRRDGMCWREESELYNEGQAFKLTCRDEMGVIVTLIADNYFGYCKKEVKTQISYAANLYGLCEEEHAGGALVFPSYDLGEEFNGAIHVKPMGHTFSEIVSTYKDLMELQPGGWAQDTKFPEIIYVPEDARFDLHEQRISWSGGTGKLKLLEGKIYVRPSGYKLRMEKPSGNRSWRLISTAAEGIFCHKPCTVSGGGKSEISKPISDAIIQGPVFVADLKTDLKKVDELIRRDYSDRFKDPNRIDKRALLAPERSLGSVIKLLTPDLRDYTPKYNDWLNAIPQFIKEFVFVVKRYYKPEWGENWGEHFSVDAINGTPGNELKCDNRRLVTNYLRVGYDEDGSWRTFGLRKDFYPAAKLQQEDDISATMTVPRDRLKPGLHTAQGRQVAAGEKEGINVDNGYSLKFVSNCEQRLFQRPDEAIHRGYDKQTELDFAADDNFFSNYEPLDTASARNLVEDAIGFHQFTEQIQTLIRDVAQSPKPQFFISPAHPRLVDGKPTRNPRYLQKRPDLVNPRDRYLAEMGARLRRRLSPDAPVLNPVTAILPGRRNNPPEPHIRSLAVFNPIHYLELPELFMEFICSVTGKSPSTTGAGSEGALTKGPFNALPPIIDLNNALVSWVLTGHHGFVTAAGYLGPKARVDHDISLLVPEVWCRMDPEERDPQFLIANHFLEKCEDFEHHGHRVLAGRLGYRINERFVQAFFGRVFNHPNKVFTTEMLRPELQDVDVFADGVDNIVTVQKRVAEIYFADGSIDRACPPLKALLEIMVYGNSNGRGVEHPEVRNLFKRDYLLASDWYQERLKAKQAIDRKLFESHINYLQRFLKRVTHADEAERLGIADRLRAAQARLREVQSPDYLTELSGTIGAEPITAETLNSKL
jgi:hypothetical protein